MGTLKILGIAIAIVIAIAIIGIGTSTVFNTETEMTSPSPQPAMKPTPTTKETPEMAQDMVSSAIILYDEIGTDAFDQFDNNPKFHAGELYVYVVRVDDGQIMAHGVDKSIIGKNNYDILDADGVNLGELIINGATQNGAWIDYKYKDPVNQEILPKEAWVIKHDDFVFGSGIYLQEN